MRLWANVCVRNRSVKPSGEMLRVKGWKVEQTNGRLVYFIGQWESLVFSLNNKITVFFM